MIRLPSTLTAWALVAILSIVGIGYAADDPAPEAAVAEAPPATDLHDVTVLAGTLTPATVPPGAAFTLQYAWAPSKPMKAPYTVFVHVLNSADKMVFQLDHGPPVGTSTPGWQGDVRYDLRHVAKATLPDGDYRILVGLYNKEGRVEMNAGPGVVDAGGGRYQIATLHIDHTAPWPQADTEKQPTLDLTKYEMTWNDEFDGPLDVSPWGPDTRWIAHTPWAGDFGDARFADPGPDFPFTIVDGVLRIEARKNDKGKWSAGLLASNDPRGKGFSQQYGYFEIRTKLPPGPGVWPAFWLMSSYDRKDKTAGDDGSVEIDIIEYYGHSPNAYSATVHSWLPKPKTGIGHLVTTKPGEAAAAFHTYGCDVQPDVLTFYFDGIDVWQTPTPPSHNKPLMVLINLALGPGWPIDKTPNPSVMEVDYVRVYRKKQ